MLIRVSLLSIVRRFVREARVKTPPPCPVDETRETFSLGSCGGFVVRFPCSPPRELGERRSGRLAMLGGLPIAKRPVVQLPVCNGPASFAMDETDAITGRGQGSRQGVGNAASLPATARRTEPVTLSSPPAATRNVPKLDRRIPYVKPRDSGTIQ